MRQSSITLFLILSIVGQLVLSDESDYQIFSHKTQRDVSQVAAFRHLSPETLKSLEQIKSGSERFSFEMFTQIAELLNSVDYDFVISPFSIWCLLVLLAEGASGNTYTQLQKALHLPDDMTPIRTAYKQIQNQLIVNTPTVEIAVSQALFADENRDISVEYADTLELQYQASYIPVHFANTNAAYRLINNHVRQVTRGKIQEIVTVDDLQEAQMMLISALYFKGQWTTPFNQSDTRQEKFYDENNQFVENVNMMYQKGNFKYAAIKDLQSYIIEIPYGKEDRLCMIGILPIKGVTVSKVFEKLAGYSIKRIIDELHKYDDQPADEDSEIEVYLPRFDIQTDFNLNVVLERLGITDAFNVNRANFAKASSQPLYVSRIIHKTIIKVDEAGTTAASASGATLINKQTPTTFYANRPFGFMIVERTTNSVLFTGQVRRPGLK